MRARRPGVDRRRAPGRDGLLAALCAGAVVIASFGCGARSCASTARRGPWSAGGGGGSEAAPAGSPAGEGDAAPATAEATAGPAPQGDLGFHVRDAETGQAIPCRLTLIGTHGTRTPELARDDLPRPEKGAISIENRIMSITGKGSVWVPHGTYDIYVSRGPEWDVSIVRDVRIAEGGAAVDTALRHVVTTPGWLSADFHVHAAASFDSRVPMLARVYEFVSDGVEMIVSTDHNFISNYAPYIAELDAGRYLLSATGDEITTKSWGHFGAFPLEMDYHAPGQGAASVRGRTPRAILRGVRAEAPNAVIDVHHPRFGQGIGYFTTGQLDAEADRARAAGFSFDFDAIEVLNGYEGSDRKSLDPVMADWFALLRHGHLVTATGNSDTHHLNLNVGGYPRNYVRLSDDRPSSARPEDVAAAVKQRRAFFTTGPFLEIAVGDVLVGDVAPAPGGEARVTVTVRAAPWIDVSSVIVYVDGVEAKRWTVAPTTDVVRLREELLVSVSRDAFVVARAGSDKPLSPVVGDAERFSVLPVALTNPIFLDVDGNGRYDPPAPHGPHAP
jgi:hypothetical protein